MLLRFHLPLGDHAEDSQVFEHMKLYYPCPFLLLHRTRTLGNSYRELGFPNCFPFIWVVIPNVGLENWKPSDLKFSFPIQITQIKRGSPHPPLRAILNSQMKIKLLI